VASPAGATLDGEGPRSSLELTLSLAEIDEGVRREAGSAV
jgi:hypothetical protein